jgi:hypothetical protein
MKTEIKKVQVGDNNNRDAGMQTIKVELWDDDNINSITHKSETYFPTGKKGVNLETGKAVIEMATDTDARLWATLDANMIFED